MCTGPSSRVFDQMHARRTEGYSEVIDGRPNLQQSAPSASRSHPKSSIRSVLLPALLSRSSSLLSTHDSVMTWRCPGPPAMSRSASNGQRGSGDSLGLLVGLPAEVEVTMFYAYLMEGAVVAVLAFVPPLVLSGALWATRRTPLSARGVMWAAGVLTLCVAVVVGVPDAWAVSGLILLGASIVFAPTWFFLRMRNRWTEDQHTGAVRPTESEFRPPR